MFAIAGGKCSRQPIIPIKVLPIKVTCLSFLDQTTKYITVLSCADHGHRFRQATLSAGKAADNVACRQRWHVYHFLDQTKHDLLLCILFFACTTLNNINKLTDSSGWNLVIFLFSWQHRCRQPYASIMMFPTMVPCKLKEMFSSEEKLNEIENNLRHVVYDWASTRYPWNLVVLMSGAA